MKKIIAILLVCLMAFAMIPMMSSAAEMTVENVALGKAAVDGNGNSAPLATDGKTDGYVDVPWNSGTDAEPVPNPNCWVEIDLGAETAIKAIKVANYPWPANYYQWEAFGSNDNTKSIEEWTKLCEKKDEKFSGAGASGYLYEVTDTEAYRYVRVVGTYHSGNIGYHFNEIAVYAETDNSLELGTVVKDGELNDGAAYWQVVVSEKYGGGLTFNLFSDADTAPTLDDYETPDQAPWYEFKDQITTANIYGVANVPALALKGYTNVRTIQIGEGVTTIGGDAFAEIGTITNLYIPLSVTTMHQGTTYATGVTNCFFPGTLETWQARWGTDQMWFSADAPRVNTVDGVEYKMYNYQNGYWGDGVVGETSPDFTGCPTVIPGNENPPVNGDATVYAIVFAAAAILGMGIVVTKKVRV